MIKLLSNALAKKLYALPFLELIGGLTVVVEKVDTIGGETDLLGASSKDVQSIMSRFPGTLDIYNKLSSCKIDGPIAPMVPNTAFAGISYFEDLSGPQLVKSQTDRFVYRVPQLRLVVWLNGAKLEGTAIDISARAQIQCMQAIYRPHSDSNGITSILINGHKFPRQDKALFAPYTMDQARDQFLTYPYQYFAIDFDITIDVRASCFQALVINTVEC